MAWSTAIEAALRAPAGARFHKCALQVNPFQYVIDNAKKTAFADEASYNAAIVAALLAEGVEVIAVTDHYRVKTSVGLWKAAVSAGIVVLPGFEAVTKDGVHFLCLFDPSKGADAIERAIGACGVHGDGSGAVGELDSLELLAKGKDWGAVFVAAHVVAAGGLLSTLKGASRAAVWRDELLMACSLPGPVSAAPDAHRNILRNRDPAHKRTRPVAVINAQDVSAPEAVSKAGSWCWIKVSEITVQGLRQAFLDPESRVRLGSDAVPDPHNRRGQARRRDAVPTTLSDADIRRLDKHLRRDTNIEGCRLHLWYWLELDTGARPAEQAGIWLADIDTEEHSIRIRGKGAKNRIVYFGDGTAAILQRYLRVRGESKHPELFLGRRGPMGAETFSKLFREVADEVSLAGAGRADGDGEEAATLYILRRTFARLFAENGGTVEELARLMGHEPSSIPMLLKLYYRPSDERLRRAHRRIRPVDALFDGEGA